jgi:hypothetical protein
VEVTGNEDGAHHVISEIADALIDIGYTIPGQAWTYWNRLPSRPVQRQHEQLAWPFPQRLLDHRRRQQRPGLLMPAQLELGGGQVLDRREPELDQPGALVGGVFTPYAGQRRALPQLKGTAQLGRLRLDAAGSPGVASGPDPALEVGEINRSVAATAPSRSSRTPRIARC